MTVLPDRPGQENRREHSDKQGNPDSQPLELATQVDIASLRAGGELGKQLGTMWPDRLEAGL